MDPRKAKRQTKVTRTDRRKMAGLQLAGYNFRFFRGDHSTPATVLYRGWYWSRPGRVSWIGTFATCHAAVTDCEAHILGPLTYKTGEELPWR